MALDKLTIIDGGGLNTTSDYRVGVITATKFVGPFEGSITATDATFSGNVSIAGTLTYEDVTNVDSVGIITARNGIKVSTGTATTALVVDGDARVTGILTVGTGSLTLDGPNNLVNVGTALTLGHTQGLQFHTQNLHSEGFEINQINASGIVTASQGLRVPNGSATTNYISVGNNGALRFWGTGHQYADIRAGNLHFRNASLQNVLEIQQDKDVFFYGNAYLQNARFDQTVTIADTITHHGDTNTKIRFPSADTITFETSGSERLRINASGNVKLPDNTKIELGGAQTGSGDLKLYHDGSNTYIMNNTGYMVISSESGSTYNDADNHYFRTADSSEYMAKFLQNGAVELYHNNSKKFQTTSGGATVTGALVADQLGVGDNEAIYAGGSSDIQLYHDASGSVYGTANSSYIKVQGVHDNILDIFTASATGKIRLKSNNLAETMLVANGNGAVELYHNNTKTFQTTNFGAEVIFTSGGGNDPIFKVLHGNLSQGIGFGYNTILATGTNTNVDLRLESKGSGLIYAIDTLQAQAGVNVTGTVVADGISVGNGEHISLGNSNQFKLYHDGSNAALQTTSGNTYLYGGGGNFLIRPVNAEQGLNVIANGAVELFHNDVKVCTTTTEGIRVQGTEGGGGKVEIYADEGDDNADKWHLLANTDGTLLIRNLSDGSWDTNIKLSSTSTELYADDDRVFFTETRGVRIGDTTKIFEDSTHASAVIQNTDIHHSIILRGSSNAAGTTITPGNTTTFREYGKFVFRTGPTNAQERFIIEAGGTCKFIKGVEGGTDEDIAKFIPDGAVELYHNASKKLETTSGGVTVTGNVTSNHSNGQVLLAASDGSIELTRTSGGAYIDFKDSTSEDYDIRINEEGGAFRVNTHFRIYDNKALELGNRTSSTYGDLRLFHDASDSYIENHTGVFFIQNAGDLRIRVDNTDAAIHCVRNGAVELHHAGTKKFETSSDGTKFSGSALFPDNQRIKVGGDASTPDLQIWHDGSHTRMYHQGTGQFIIYGNDNDQVKIMKGPSEEGIILNNNGNVELFHNNQKKLETKTGGVDITGNMECDGITSSGGMATTSGYVNLQGSATMKLLLQGADGQLIRYRNAASTYTASITSIGNGDTFQLLNEKQSQYLNIETGGVRIGGRLTLPTTDTGISFGPGTAANDSAHIEWKGGDNAGYLRISTDDDSDAITPAEYIEFGDYATIDRGGAFTQHVKIARSEFLVRTGSHTVTVADRFKIDSNGVTRIYKDLYLTDELNMTDGGNKNRFIDASMANNEALFLRSTQGGDTGHQNMALFHRNGSVNLYHANSEKIATQAHGINVYGDIHMGGLSNTGTNQNRQIYWTGFDKESSGDNSDFAHIKHTTNIHGITGSVLEIKAENDASDGIALAASNGNGIVAAVCKKFDVSGYIEPSYGSGDNGIKWPTDPAGGSGDIATIQYYADGSGENLRLRILVANDGDDDLFLEAPGGVYVQGTLGAQTKNFRIPHVLPGLTTTTDLIHSSVESPQADNIYRGRTKLVAGISTVNIDTTNNMTDGTFVNLNRDVQCFTTNETGWTNVKGSVTGNLLTIIAQDNACTDTISWMVIGERWDLAMYNPDNPSTDENGKIKTEVPNRNYAKGYNEDYIRENKLRVGISTISRPSIENKEVE